VKPDSKKPNTNQEDYKCPETVPESQTGTTDEEKEWALKKEGQASVPRSLFAIIALILIIAFLFGGIWYYRVNILPEKNYRRAAALFKEEKFEDAAIYFEKVAKIKPERKDVYNKIGQCYERIGQPDKALESYQLHLKGQPNDVSALIGAGKLLFKRGDVQESLNMLRNAIKHSPKNIEAWEPLAEAALASGDNETAVKALTVLAYLYKAPGKVHSAAEKLMKLGAWEQALASYEKLAEDPSDDKARNGMKAAKTMLGYPTDPAFEIVPEKSVGAVKIGMTKNEVKAVAGRPSVKEFKYVSDRAAEIWKISPSGSLSSMRVMFMDERVREIETRSPAYKTRRGIGLSNFLLDPDAKKISLRQLEDGSVRAVLKSEKGLTFYGAGLDSKKERAKYSKLRVHKGAAPLDHGSGVLLRKIEIPSED
jgi:tetratricopeptide (TPR) repeat protein